MSVKEIAKGIGNNLLADTPKWAKWVRIAGLVVVAAGSTITKSTAQMPDALTIAAPYMIDIGSFLIAFVQFFKK